MKTFYQMSGEDTMKQLNGSAEPLTESQVKEHQEKYGRNELVEGKKKTVLQIFLEQYKDFLVIILIIAAIASGFMGDVESTAVILIVITMNAIGAKKVVGVFVLTLAIRNVLYSFSYVLLRLTQRHRQLSSAPIAFIVITIKITAVLSTSPINPDAIAAMIRMITRKSLYCSRKI